MERWISFLQSYDEILTMAAAVVLGLIIILILARILRQIKRLNQSLLGITNNIQAYFDVIMQEEPQEQEEMQEQEGRTPEPQWDRHTEAAEDLAEQEHKKQEEELFNSVLQEYFS